MSFINIGTDGPPNHTLEIEGSIFISNVSNTSSSIVPLELKDFIRIRNKPTNDSSKNFVTDIIRGNQYTGITAPSLDASRSATDFCIDNTGNVGIGVVPTEKLDVEGNMFATGSLTNESNIVTGTLTSTGTLTCNTIAYGENSNIYGLLPSNVILMTTLTSTPAGWTDITAQFTDRNVLLAEDKLTLTTGGDDIKNLPSVINHAHNWDTKNHQVQHEHNANGFGNQNTASTVAGGGHTHNLSGFNNNTNYTSEHSHPYSYKDTNTNWGQSSPWFLYSGNYLNWYYINNYYILANENFTHNHGTTGLGYNTSTEAHGHNIGGIGNAKRNTNTTHTHYFEDKGSSTPLNIAPSYYTVRFIKKN